VLEAKDMKWNNGIVKLSKRADLLEHGVTLTVEPARTLKVLAKDEKGNPLNGATVYLGLAYGFPKSQSRTTDDSGVVTFDHIINGAIYRFPSVKLEGYSSKPTESTLTVGSPGWKDTIEIVMESP
jgi:hypothetical protein